MVADIVASDWNNRIRDVVIKMVGKIPEVGSVVSVLVGIFWPENKTDVFQALKADMTKLVDKKILEYELNLSQSQIKGLRVVIERYKTAKNNEKGALLDIWITRADELSVQFRDSTNNIHLILLVINLAVLHLAGLRERLDFGKVLYHEDNTKQWQEDLEKMYRTYIVDFLPKIFKKWQVWRADQIQIRAWTKRDPPSFLADSYASTEDTITGWHILPQEEISKKSWEKKNFRVDLVDSLYVFKNICNAHKTRMFNDANSDMAGCIATTFEFYKILPNQISKNFPKYDKDVFGRIFKGPYSEDLYWSERHFGLGNPVPIFRVHPDNDDYSPNSGQITKMVIREWNSIDAMQFVYANHEGKLAGNPLGGKRHDIDVTKKPINGFSLGLSNGVLVSVKINYYDGTSSSTFGNRGGWKVCTSSPKGPPVYKLSSWSYKQDFGPSKTYGPSVVQFEYAPQIE